MATECKGRSSRNLAVNESKCCVCSEKILEIRAVCERVLSPDKIKGRVVVTSAKKSVDEVKNSVERRLDYILQLFRKNKIKDSEIQVSKQLTRKGDLFTLRADVVFILAELKMYEEITNTILEKLGMHSVISVSEPDVFHSPGKLEAHRLAVCLEAVQNAKTKALKVAETLNQKLGTPLSVVEEEMKETSKTVENKSTIKELLIEPLNTLPLKLEAVSVTVRCKVVVRFQLIS